MCIFSMYEFMIFFFFQAEDGIRDKLVTGVQTCALPIFTFRLRYNAAPVAERHGPHSDAVGAGGASAGPPPATIARPGVRRTKGHPWNWFSSGTDWPRTEKSGRAPMKTAR